MFDFGLSELLLIAIVAVLFIGPKELPVIMAQLGRVFKRLNYMRYAISRQFDDFMRESGMDEIRNDVNFEAPSGGQNAAIAPQDAHKAALEVIEKPKPKSKSKKPTSKKTTAKKAAVKSKKSSSGSAAGSRKVKPENDTKRKKVKADD